ncbi:multidrug transporter [Pseudomonas aeruginosa VRFPA08]|nr:multidrug transporter [Pseudomonas aeruginosa VRFPA08]
MSESRFNLSALAVRERSVTLFLVCLISLAGLVAFFKLGRAEDPAFTIKVMTIVTAWPGATAQEMQDQVAEKIEKRLQELRWYDRSETYTRPGLAFTTLSLLDTTPPSEVLEEFYQARKKISDEAKTLPTGVIGPLVNDEYSDVTFALFALKARGEPQRHLVRDAETLRQRLLHVPGVKKVNIIGEQAERIFVEFYHERLATLGIGPQDVFAALNGQNALTPAGSVETRGPDVFLRLDGAFDELEKIRDTPIIAQGRTLKLSDVATVKRGYEDPATFLIRNGGEPALLLGIIMREGWNGLDLGKALNDEVQQINAELPLGMSLSKVTDQAVNISASVDEFMIKFFVALLVVMLVCFVSMGWRVGVVVAVAVPLTLAMVFVVMAATGKNFDRITLGSLILALGLLVDDAIIAIEMMVVKMEEGYDRVRASAYAWSHTAAPMLSGTLVTAVGFMPNGFARSTAGEYTSNMFWIVGIALIASWLVAVIFTPYFGVKLLPEIKKVEGGHDAIYDTPRYNHFRRILGKVIAHKWLVAGSVIGLFVTAVLGMALVKKQFFPISDRPEVMVEVQMPYGTSILQTSAAAEKVEAWLAQQAEAKIVTAYLGQGAPRFFMAMSPELPDPSFAKIVVRTDNPDEREALKHRLRKAIAEGLASEAQVRVSQLVFGPYSPYPVAYRISGPDPQRLREIASEVRQVMDASPLMRTVNTDWGTRAPTLHFNLQQDRLQAVGLTSSAVAQQLQFFAQRRACHRRTRRHPHGAGHGPCRWRYSPRPGTGDGFHPGRRQWSAHPAVADWRSGGTHGRADHALARPGADYHSAWRYRRRLATARRVDRHQPAVATHHRQAAERLSHRASGLHRGIGQSQQGHAAAVPDHAGRHVDHHHPAGALDRRDDHGLSHQPAGADRRSADADPVPAAVRHQRAGRADRAVRHPHA